MLKIINHRGNKRVTQDLALLSFSPDVFHGQGLRLSIPASSAEKQASVAYFGQASVFSQLKPQNSLDQKQPDH